MSQSEGRRGREIILITFPFTGNLNYWPCYCASGRWTWPLGMWMQSRDCWTCYGTFIVTEF